MSLQGSSLLEETISTLVGLSGLHLPSCGFTEKRRGGRRGFSVGGAGARGAQRMRRAEPSGPRRTPSASVFSPWRSLSVSASCSRPWVARGLGPSRGPGWCGDRSLQEELGGGVGLSKRPSEPLNLSIGCKKRAGRFSS